MVVVGAGASLDLGMPSVKRIDRLFKYWASKDFKLLDNPRKNLYTFIRDTISNQSQQSPTNYEEMLFIIGQLAKFQDETIPERRFLSPIELPEITRFGERETRKATKQDLIDLASCLVGNLLNYFRKKCCKTSAKKHSKKLMVQNFKMFRDFIKNLAQTFEIAFITLNHDNLITQVFGSNTLFTGFDSNGNFNASSVLSREKFDLIYHLHGSAHFETKPQNGRLRDITWNNDLNSINTSDSGHLSSSQSSEKNEVLNSVIVAGYLKTEQIQRAPFRTYYACLDKIVHESDSILFLGYGFNDNHVNNSFEFNFNRQTDKPRQIVVVTFTETNPNSLGDPIPARVDDWSFKLLHTLRLDGNRDFPPVTRSVHSLRNDFEWETTNKNSERPISLSIWHWGFMEACKQSKRIIERLNS